MNRTGVISAGLVTLGLAAAMHLDWHVARPTEHHLSLGWQWHWLLAAPVFGLTAWYVLRAWPERVGSASVTILGIASLLGGIVEPAWEWADGASLESTFGQARLAAFGAFLVTGIITHVTLLRLLRRHA